MENTHIPAEERAHLETVLATVEAQLKEALESRKANQEELNLLREELMEDRELSNLWGMEEFEDLADLSQSVRAVTLQEETQDTTLAKIIALKYQKNSPYFARLLLQFPDEDEQEAIHIGRFSLWDPKESDLAVHDWRSPIASLFYRFTPGPAHYDAPMGRIDCHLAGKRQYDIRKGKMVYCFDADEVIQDVFLKRMLSQNASPRMKAIVETIQRDQDLAIRDEQHNLLMVQGVAGSGKTSIALHRVAYLMYEGLKNRLRPHNILILSPNTIFEKYIASVLPELGEKATASATLEELLSSILHKKVQARFERLDALCAASAAEKDAKTRWITFQSSREFLLILQRFIREIPRSLLKTRTLAYAGQVLLSASDFRNEIFHQDKRWPLGVHLRRIEGRLWEEVHALRPQRIRTLEYRALHLSRGSEWARAYSILETRALAREIRAVTRPDPETLYRRLLCDPALFRSLAKDISLPEDLDALLEQAIFTLPQEGPLPLGDAAAIAYLTCALYGETYPGDIRQVAVDEAQDLGITDYALLHLLFPRARFTVLGDIHQSMERPVAPGFFEEVSAALEIKNATLMELNKSFRCTKEILDFSGRFLENASIESYNRSGEAPRLLPLSNLNQEIDSCREKGYKSIALICKTQEEARKWENRLDKSLGVRLMGRDAHTGDAFLVPLSLTKGLEFDAVLVLDCDESHYTLGDERLLYVACTRALHHLCFFYEGEISPLLKGAK
ncbi:MAG: helicase [Clostridiales bacterium]|nr:helicase [Clostridiales bacterium]